MLKKLLVPILLATLFLSTGVLATATNQGTITLPVGTTTEKSYDLSKLSTTVGMMHILITGTGEYINYNSTKVYLTSDMFVNLWLAPSGVTAPQIVDVLDEFHKVTVNTKEYITYYNKAECDANPLVCKYQLQDFKNEGFVTANWHTVLNVWTETII
jgi:hypothetical protein